MLTGDDNGGVESKERKKVNKIQKKIGDKYIFEESTYELLKVLKYHAT